MVSADEVRRIALSLPEAEERETWGHPTFRVRGKLFAGMAADGHNAGFKASKLDQEALVAGNPTTFSVAAYGGRYGWVEVQLATADPDELREMIIESWRLTAPKRLVAVYDAQR